MINPKPRVQTRMVMHPLRMTCAFACVVVGCYWSIDVGVFPNRFLCGFHPRHPKHRTPMSTTTAKAAPTRTLPAPAMPTGSSVCTPPGEDQGAVLENGFGGDVDAALGLIRAMWEADAESEQWFYHRVLGGQWTAAHVGVAAGGIGGFARTGMVKRWCVLFSWPRQFSCAFAAYGHDDSNRIVREWIRRSAYFSSCGGLPVLQAASSTAKPCARGIVKHSSSSLGWRSCHSGLRH